MHRLFAIIVLIASCLIPNTVIGEELEPGEPKLKKQKTAEKVIVFLAKAGIYSDSIKQAAYFVDERVEDGYVNIQSAEYQGVKMQLRYDADSIKMENLEVRFTSEDMPNWEMKGTSRGAMLNYQLEF